MKKNWIYVFVIVIILFGVWYYFTQQSNSDMYEKTKTTESGKSLNGAKGYGVSASNSLAVEVGMDVLENNGNAVDAAIAISYALGVVEPYGSGIGGGGGMLILPGDEEKSPTFFDYRETSPISGSRLKDGVVGIPGFVKGMEVIHKKYGEKELVDLIDPSIELAEKGFRVQQSLTDRLKSSQSRLSVSKLPNFFPHGKPIQKGKWLKQPKLAETLTLIKEEGADAFYEGKIAEHIAHEVPGIKESDFKSYSVSEKEPVYGEFSGYEVISAPPPFSGITLIQSLQMADMLNVKETAESTGDFIHLTGQIYKRAYNDRLIHIGDPDFVKIPVEKLTEKDYAKKLTRDISLEKVSKSTADEDGEHISTTHFVVIDHEGTVVSVTNTLSNFFGVGKSTGGFFLNNNLNSFNEKIGSPNEYKPGKRARTFTAPTILRKDDEIIGIGTPGGNRIPMMLAGVLIRHLQFHEPLQSAIDAPRFYIEGNQIKTEVQYSTGIQNELKKKGYTIKVNSYPIYYGGIQALVIDRKENVVWGAADPRREGIWQAKPQ